MELTKGYLTGRSGHLQVGLWQHLWLPGTGQNPPWILAFGIQFLVPMILLFCLKFTRFCLIDGGLKIPGENLRNQVTCFDKLSSIDGQFFQRTGNLERQFRMTCGPYPAWQGHVELRETGLGGMKFDWPNRYWRYSLIPISAAVA